MKTQNKTFVIAISFGQNTEYWNSFLVNDENTTQHIESAEGFKSKKDANYALENYVQPFSIIKKWDVSFSIENIN